MRIRLISYLLLLVSGIFFSGHLSAEEKSGVLKRGDASPEFNAWDINGNPVKIKDFRGKYVYIDVWATWCEPCLMEAPHLKTLEQQFRKKKIVFVGISSEKNTGKWAAMVKEKQMAGVQLNTQGDKSFEKAFDVQGIPRFILLDKKGRVLNPDMTRPSDPETVKTLRKLR